MEAAENLEAKVQPSGRLLDSYSLKQWMEGPYLASIQTTSAKHQEKARWAISHLGKLADCRIEEVNRNMLQTLVDSKTEGSRVTFRSVLMSAFTLAEADDVIQKNPCKFVKARVAVKPQKRTLTGQELRTLIEHSRGYAAHPIVILGGLMGLRIGEIVRLKPEHFAQPGKLIVPGTKTNASPRELPLPDAVLKELTSETFPLASYGSPARNALERAVWRSQIIDFKVTPHLLRHSFSTNLEWLGCPHDVRSRLLGHGKKTITERYSHGAWNTWEKWLEELCLHVFLGKKLGTDQKKGARNE